MMQAVCKTSDAPYVGLVVALGLAGAACFQPPHNARGNAQADSGAPEDAGNLGLGGCLQAVALPRGDGGTAYLLNSYAFPSMAFSGTLCWEVSWCGSSGEPLVTVGATCLGGLPGASDPEYFSDAIYSTPQGMLWPPDFPRLRQLQFAGNWDGGMSTFYYPDGGPTPATQMAQVTWEISGAEAAPTVGQPATVCTQGFTWDGGPQCRCPSATGPGVPCPDNNLSQCP